MRINVLAVALIANLSIATAALAAPELSVERGTFNFGTITQGKKVQHNFVLKNTGDSPLQIKDLVISCGCTAAKPSTSTILPGKTAEIQTTFDSTNFSGKVEKSITVVTNAGKTPNYTLTMEGNILEQVQVNPRQLILGQIPAGGSKQATVAVTNRSNAPFKLLTATFNSNTLQAKTSIKKNVLKPGETGNVELTVSMRPDAKIFSGYLHITTDHPQKKELTVPVYATAPK